MVREKRAHIAPVKKGRCTIPVEIRRYFGFAPEESFYLEFSLDEKTNTITARPVGIHKIEQSWFWTARHQALEREADESLQQGEFSGPFDIEELITSLAELKGQGGS